MTLLLIANIALVMGALLGMYCIAHKDKRGFVIFLAVEASMAYIGYATSNYGLIIAAMLYLVMNVYSYTKWTQAENARRATSDRVKIVNDAIADGRLKIVKSERYSGNNRSFLSKEKAMKVMETMIKKLDESK